MVKLYPVENNDIQAAVQAVLDDFKPAARGARALLKPNMLGPFAPEKGTTTSPELVRSLVLGLEALGAKDIIVSDSPGGVYNTAERTAGITGIGEAALGRFRPMNDSERVEVKLESSAMPTLPISRFVFDADLFINLPKFKTHTLTTITGCIKNSFGLVVGNIKMTVHRAAPNLKKFHQAMVDIYAIRPPDLNIMDAITVMEGNGPSHGGLRTANLLLAGENGVEVDAVMAAMMGLEPESVPMLTIARDRGLGEIDLKKIDIRGPFKPIPGFKTPSTAFAAVQAWGNIFAPVLNVVPALVREKCIKCGQCEGNCPTRAIGMDPWPRINRRKCISCFCCAELCPEGALEIPTPGRDMLRRLLRR